MYIMFYQVKLVFHYLSIYKTEGKVNHNIMAITYRLGLILSLTLPTNIQWIARSYNSWVAEFEINYRTYALPYIHLFPELP